MPSNHSSVCTHQSICFDCSRHAAQAGFERPGLEERVSAQKEENESTQSLSEDNPEAFPAPLVLPGDEIAEDPEYPSQSFQEWLDKEDRNPVNTQRKIVYVAPPPQIDDSVEFLRSLVQPQQHDKGPRAQSPHHEDVHGYVSAFYHGLPVKLLPQSTLRLVSWDSGRKPSKTAPSTKPARPRYVGLQTTQECVRIRLRPSKDGVFQGQLNLNDLLDAAISMLPRDAYALLLLVHHDIYEDENDDFSCGRAYGGSRVAVVSSARYNPGLDELESVERLHAWPASHCGSYITRFCDAAEEDLRGNHSIKSKKPRTKKSKLPAVSPGSGAGPMDAAVSVHRSLPTENMTAVSLSALWLGRFCRTASHELGHCFGIDHCMYYACSMQGTASVGEDAAQPPYLCPVDLAKVLHATSGDVVDRYRALLAFCERPGNKKAHIFAPFGAWIRARVKQLNVNNDDS
ncbi:hypothetical protein N7532_001968 [Penicillium argentinense]|uniref:Uncharacterized protein n=1 Tax=Penicillium argentinense TaxID=1131581 RepID=A0A9W9KMX9_9EURO|nr:uncharacterized protein N7532_001968 [Penicillium argentinense]KAJ5111433.1 hypothetical protein N7532_001968 [Penicillium argentinense]